MFFWQWLNFFPMMAGGSTIPYYISLVIWLGGCVFFPILFASLVSKKKRQNKEKLEQSDWFLLIFLMIYLFLWGVYLPVGYHVVSVHPYVFSYYVDWVRLGILLIVSLLGFFALFVLNKKKIALVTRE
jgi:uncharacterized membrane protein